jgi:hypothetical protein
MLAKSVVVPTTLNTAVRKHAPTVPLPAPKYWQSRHQQVRVVIGGSSLSQRTEPQRQPPVNVIALSQGQEIGDCKSYLRGSLPGGVPRRRATAAFGGSRVPVALSFWLRVWEHNQRAIRLYTSWGFERQSTLDFDMLGSIKTDWLMTAGVRRRRAQGTRGPVWSRWCACAGVGCTSTEDVVKP